jgi:uncharacterized protein (DUF58 family)
MSPTNRAALVLVALALAAPFVASWLILLAVVALLAATAADALLVARSPKVKRVTPLVLVRGRPVALQLGLEPPVRGRARLRQPVGPDLRLVPGEAEGALDGELTPRRRGRHPLPPAAVRVRGPLSLGQWTHTVGPELDVRVYPDLPGARRIATSVRQGRFREEGRRTRGPLGLGTDFETLREYAPDDDIRQVNWLATARFGRPISNQFRVERDREVICVIDCGRLSAAPVGAATRLDLALDAAVAVAAVAEELGDRCGAIAFDAQVRRIVLPRRNGTQRLVDALFDLEPTPVESDYERAFVEIQRAKRAFVLILTDLIEPAAARPLLEALPVLTRRHAVTIASVSDPDLAGYVEQEPQNAREVYRLSATLEVLADRGVAAAQLRHAGGEVIEARPEALPAACVSAYLRAKRRARL